jgi:hypothetical protein
MLWSRADWSCSGVARGAATGTFSIVGWCGFCLFGEDWRTSFSCWMVVGWWAGLPCDVGWDIYCTAQYYIQYGVSVLIKFP